LEQRYVVLPAASKASGIDTGAPASATCPYGTNAESPLVLAGANRPLAGIVVLDFGQVYQGPYATLLMAKAGADVIKIEPPQGEPLRRRAPAGKSTTFPIAMLNANKRAITLNLKHEGGRALQ
jgi:crotonobetainyl-CoA:carnitine CoA-transferase CaiB-like acyl-CoA transferase